MVNGLYNVNKCFRSWWNIDALGYIRGKYKSPLFAIRIGYTAVRNVLRDQLAATAQEGLENMGTGKISVLN